MSDSRSRSHWGRVAARPGLILRDSPQDGEALCVLADGTEIEVLERSVWLRVRVAGREGFVLGDWVERETELVPPATSAGLAAGAAAPIAQLTDFVAPHFVGEPARVDMGFVSALEWLEAAARERGIGVWVTSSFRRMAAPIGDEIVPSGVRSNHLVGHAIDVNLYYDNRHFNSQDLRRSNWSRIPEALPKFLSWLPEAKLVWGGNLEPAEPGHIDDGLWQNDPALWERKFKIHQAGAV